MSKASRRIQGIIVGQTVQPIKLERAKGMRQNMTVAERSLWNCLRANQLDGLRWRRQQVIDGFIVDFYCHAAKVIIEVDGEVHMDQQEYDTARDDVLAARDIRIMRFSNQDVLSNLTGVIARIRALCQERVLH